MSDCQSWFGAARSKRRWRVLARTCGGPRLDEPASCRMRRTVDSETPSASHARKEVPDAARAHSGSAVRMAITASRWATRVGVGGLRPSDRSVFSASAPCSR